jgi:hypothetical protein
MVDYAQICFVIMPFGRKEVSNRWEVDFDRIYPEIFEPATRLCGFSGLLCWQM